MLEMVKNDAWQAVARWLEEASAYGESGEVKVVETHISRVYLVGDQAWKLKKPLHYDFLDYSSAEQRRLACEAEVRLNRRLASDVYRGVVAVCRLGNGALALGGAGEPVEWLVHMRRLDDDDSLQSRMSNGRLTDSNLAALVDKLSDFYANADRSLLETDAFCREIENHLRANRAALLAAERSFDATAIERIHQAQLRMLLLRPQVFADRVEQRRIVDGHGDLRPEHIYFTPQPQVIDCIEFSTEFRRLDVADELSFLAMECERLQSPAVGRQIATACFARLQDHPGEALLAFYRSYRAAVRAKVAALRAEQLADRPREQSLQLARDYLAIADREVGKLPPPVLLVIRGLMGSGKSTLARWLAERLQIPVLSSDLIRRELFADEMAVPTTDRPAFGAERYHPSNRQRVYEEMFQRANELLATGQSVVLDATFISAALREQAATLAVAQRATYLNVFCDCPAEIAKARIAARMARAMDASEGRPELYDQQAQANEPQTPRSDSFSIDSRQAISIMGAQVLGALQQRLIPQP